jgi:thiamine biosynthesis lipoprotein
MTLVVNFKIVLVFICSLLLAGCNSQKTDPSAFNEIQGEVFGSYFIVKYHGSLDKQDFSSELTDFFKEFNQEFSTYQKDSVISRFNSLPLNSKLKVSARFIQMLEMAKDFHEKTNGAFDPTLGPVIQAWGFGGGQIKQAPNQKTLSQAMKKVGFSYIQWEPNTLNVWRTNEVHLDVNAFAPGWAADLIGEMLLSHKIQDYMVDISGEIIFKGKKSAEQPWVAGIETPSLEHAAGVQVAFYMKNLSIATSGNYRQYFDDQGLRKSHIIDPKSGAPVTHQISSASVLASTGAQADAWSTAMMVLGEEGLDLAEKNGIKVYLLKAKKPQVYEVIMSPGMQTFLDAHRL